MSLKAGIAPCFLFVLRIENRAQFPLFRAENRFLAVEFVRNEFQNALRRFALSGLIRFCGIAPAKRAKKVVDTESIRPRNFKLSPAQPRAFWEARARLIHRGMTQTQVEKLLPQQQISVTDIEGGTFAKTYDWDEKWAMFVIFANSNREVLQAPRIYS